MTYPMDHFGQENPKWLFLKRKVIVPGAFSMSKSVTLQVGKGSVLYLDAGFRFQGPERGEYCIRIARINLVFPVGSGRSATISVTSPAENLPVIWLSFNTNDFYRILMSSSLSSTKGGRVFSGCSWYPAISFQGLLVSTLKKSFRSLVGLKKKQSVHRNLSFGAK